MSLSPEIVLRLAREAGVSECEYNQLAVGRTLIISAESLTKFASLCVTDGRNVCIEECKTLAYAIATKFKREGAVEMAAGTKACATAIRSLATKEKGNG